MSPAFEALLNRDWLREQSVSRGTVAEVLARVVAAAPDPVPRVDIADGTMLTGAQKLPHGSVSRASNFLLRLNLLQELGAVPERPGRPVVPLQLGQDWALAGVRIRRLSGRTLEAIGALTSLDGTPFGGKVTVEFEWRGNESTLLDIVANVAGQLKKLATTGRLLGLGVEISDRLHLGALGAAEPRHTMFLGEALTQRLGMPAIVETAVNARAVLETWRRDPDSKKLRFSQSHFAVVAVFNEGVSSALVINRKIHRGYRHLAGGIGHLTVDYSRPLDGLRPASKRPGFDDPCSCDRAYGHVEALATPARIAGQLGMPFERAVRQRQVKGSTAAAAFETAGDALGRGISTLLEITGPAQLLLLLPTALARAEEGTAAAAYTRAVENAIDRYSFLTADDDGQPLLVIEEIDPDDAIKGTQAAAACVLDSFIAYARGEESLTQ